MLLFAAVLIAQQAQEHPWETRLRAAEAKIAAHEQALAAQEKYAKQAAREANDVIAASKQVRDNHRQRIEQLEWSQAEREAAEKNRVTPDDAIGTRVQDAIDRADEVARRLDAKPADPGWIEYVAGGSSGLATVLASVAAYYARRLHLRHARNPPASLTENDDSHLIGSLSR